MLVCCSSSSEYALCLTIFTPRTCGMVVPQHIVSALCWPYASSVYVDVEAGDYKIKRAMRSLPIEKKTRRQNNIQVCDM